MSAKERARLTRLLEVASAAHLLVALYDAPEDFRGLTWDGDADRAVALLRSLVAKARTAHKACGPVLGDARPFPGTVVVMGAES